MRGLVQWFLGLFSPRSGAGPRPTSQSCSSSSSGSSTSAPITSKSAPVRIKDAGVSFTKQLKAIDPAKVRFVVVHHTANANPHWGVRECHKSHIEEKGWAGIGYNYLIEQSGHAYYGRADEDRDYIGAHVEGYNSTSIGVCLDGNYDTQTPTEANLDITARIVAMCLQRYGLDIAAIRYHSDLAMKSCPGKNFPTRNTFAHRVAKFL